MKQVQTENSEPMFLLSFSHTGRSSPDSLLLCVRVSVCVSVCVFLWASSCMTSLWKCVPPDIRTPRSNAWIMCLSSTQIKTVKEHQRPTIRLVISTSSHSEPSLSAAPSALFSLSPSFSLSPPVNAFVWRNPGPKCPSAGGGGGWCKRAAAACGRAIV